MALKNMLGLDSRWDDGRGNDNKSFSNGQRRKDAYF